MSSNDLRENILEKNENINQLVNSFGSSELSVIFINKEHNFAILRMSEDVHKVIVKKGFRLNLGLQSHRLKNHYHLDQCFVCQRFGHRNTSPHCSQQTSCLYCSADHKSKDCPVKRSKSEYKCSNCSTSTKYKDNTDHTSTDNKCPFVIIETERLMKRTMGTSAEDFLAFRARHQKFL